MEKFIPEIVKRNKDVEHMMLASSKYGLHGLGKSNFNKLFSMLVLTDIHYCDSLLDSAIDYLNYYDSLDCGICLGDIHASNFANSDGKWYTSRIMRASKNFYTVLGNHDLGNSADINISATPQMAFEKFILPTAEKIGVSGLDKPYYVKLIDEYKIAIIVLLNYDLPDDLDEDGNFQVSRTYDAYSQAQTDWFIDALNSIPNDYHLIVASHSHSYDTIALECSWTQDNLESGVLTNAYGNDNMITDILDAWIHGKSIKKQYAPIIKTNILPTINVYCDFSTRGKGNFICHLIGHHHIDAISTNAKYPEQKVITLASSANDLWQNRSSDLPRTVGTKSEDLLTVFSVDTNKRQIRLVRIGSNFTINMTDRTSIMIEY